MMEPRVQVREHAGIARCREIISIGVPLPKQYAQGADLWTARSSLGERVACQTSVEATWADGSVRWLQATFPVSIEPHGCRQYTLERGEESTGPPVKSVSHEDQFEVDTGTLRATLHKKGGALLSSVKVDGKLVAPGVVCELQTADRKRIALQIEDLQVLSSGVWQSHFQFGGRFPRTGLRAQGSCIITAGSSLVRLELTVHNPSRARHRAGLWDLGDEGSALFAGLSVNASLHSTAAHTIRWRADAHAAWQTQQGGSLELHQFSSGGENYNSRNHVDRRGVVSLRIKGYRARDGKGEHEGLRANPCCAVLSSTGSVAVAGRDFWQNFPQAIRAEGGSVSFDVFASSFDSLHELQGGEQKTHNLRFLFGSDERIDLDELAAIHDPLEARCTLDWLRESSAISKLPRSTDLVRPEWKEVCRDAIEGPQNFFLKREAIDEYGWRNYGDVWADHEQEFYEGPRPIISHYNNQYDVLEGFLLTHLLTDDYRWWQLADPLARHLIDIDIYHTTCDRAAYNGGLFWITDHYKDAVTSTHRTYSAKNHPRGGGGPGNEHNFTSGLLLYSYLTGDRKARDAVVTFAQWVLNMDEGRGHLLGLVAETPTGLASQTREISYHGPGRGAGNSINALLDGYLACGRGEFLHKAAELIERTVHPEDDVASLDLGNAEMRWSYTVFFQTLIRLLLERSEFPLPEELIQYCRDSLLHYARWMADHETFYLDHPEELEFPTSTWAAQELRKANVLRGAAIFAAETERAAFAKRAEYFYDRAWSKLLSMPTRLHTRPTILALQLGLSAACLAGIEPQQVTGPKNTYAPKRRFEPQKHVVRQGLKSPLQLGVMLLRMGRVWRWPEAFRTTWAVQRVRRMWEGLRD